MFSVLNNNNNNNIYIYITPLYGLNMMYTMGHTYKKKKYHIFILLVFIIILQNGHYTTLDFTAYCIRV